MSSHRDDSFENGQIEQIVSSATGDERPSPSVSDRVRLELDILHAELDRPEDPEDGEGAGLDHDGQSSEDDP